MSVISSHIMRTGRHLQIRVPNQHIYRASFRVVTDDPNDDALVVYDEARLASPSPIPSKFDNYNFLGSVDVNSQAREFDIRQHERDKQVWWQCDVTWRPGQPGEPTPDDLVHPLERPVRYWIEYVRETAAVTKDSSGDPIVNFANQPYPEPIVRTYHRPVLMIRRNYASLETIWNLNQTYEGTTNSDVFIGQPAKTWRYAITRTNEPTEEDGITYWEGTTSIEYRASTWVENKREEGWKHFRRPPDKTLITPVDGDGAPLGEPVLLATSGDRRADGLAPEFTEWDIEDSVAYGGLIA